MPSDGAHGLDPSAVGDVEVTSVQPFQATKRYVCPGCGHAIEPGTGHVVAVPTAAPDLRRHWHHPCCWARARRRPRRP